MTTESAPSDHLSVLSDENRAALQAKKLFFTVTTGRSGTDFLSKVANLLPGVSAKHEPKPNFVDVLRRVQLGVEPELAKRWWIQEKLPRISRNNKSIYFEASHLCCKGFLEPLMSLGFMPGLVLLSRPHRDIAKSMYRLGTIPARLLRADRWYLRPDDPGVLQLSGWEQMHDYQLCYWYTLEIARRQDLYEQMLTEKGGKTLRITLQELNSVEGFQQLARFVTGSDPSLMAMRRFKWMAQRPHNTKVRAKSSRQMLLPATLDEMEREVLTAAGLVDAVSKKSALCRL